MKTRVLIVDDELWARKRIRALLKPKVEMEIVGEAEDGEQAAGSIRALAPDIVFLDVQMPNHGAFEMLAEIGPDRMPVLIFATAHSTHAVEAFDSNAADYLVKPFDEERFERALDRAKAKLEHRRRMNEEEQLRRMLKPLSKSRQFLQRLTVKHRGRIVFLPAADMDWIEAAGNYVVIHAGGSSYMLRDSMDRLEPKLDPGDFARIHRSTIVNLDRVKELNQWNKGSLALTLRNGTSLAIGRSYRNRLKQILENIPS